MIKKEQDKQGNLTIQLKVSDSNGNENEFFIHSKYDVIRDAKKFAQVHSKKLKKINILYGFGLGYHVRELLKYMDDSQVLHVYDLREDIYEFANKNIDIADILTDKRVKIFINKSQEKMAKDMKSVLEKENVILFIYKPSVMAIDEKNNKFKLMLEKLNISKNIKNDYQLMKELRNNIIENSKLSCENAFKYFDKFKGIPGVVISAGPSLDYALPYLKYLKNKAFLFSVGRALRSLLNENIEPDMFCIIDPSSITRVQIKGCEDLNIPFVYLNSVHPDTIKAYKGPKFVVYNDMNFVKNKREIVDTGQSVATAVLDMLIKFGCNPIIFVGQDLAFNMDKHHSKCASYYDENIKITNNVRKIKGIDGHQLYTNLGYLSFKNWIENKIQDNPHIEFINCSKGGVHIKGTKYMCMKSALDKYININYPIQEIIHEQININKAES